MGVRFRGAKLGVRSMATLAAKIGHLERQHEAAMILLGEMVTTLSLEPNVAKLATTEAGRELVELAGKWRGKFAALAVPPDAAEREIAYRVNRWTTEHPVSPEIARLVVRPDGGLQMPVEPLKADGSVFVGLAEVADLKERFAPVDPSATERDRAMRWRLLNSCKNALELIDAVDGSGGNVLNIEPYKSMMAELQAVVAAAERGQA